MDLEPANEVQLIIECDGHEFHKATKEQIKHDNERDYDLKMAGYDVLHYSGSQIFNDPIKCANEIYDYITIKTGGWKETKGEG
jgi:very-short-patch-repair endonuclease